MFRGSCTVQNAVPLMGVLPWKIVTLKKKTTDAQPLARIPMFPMFLVKGLVHEQ